MHRRTLVAFSVVALLAVALTPVASAATDKVDICHFSTDTGTWTLISVSAGGNAVSAHLAHGDGLPGGAVPGQPGDTFSAACLPVPSERDFAIAWTDVNGNHTYEPGTDVLIAKLVDANGDGVLDAGDLVVTNQYPLDFTGTTFGTFGVTSHTVVMVFDDGLGEPVVLDAASNAYLWTVAAVNGADQYAEGTAFHRTLQILDDAGSGGDAITAEAVSPSAPGTPVSLSGLSSTNDGFIDVQLCPTGC